MNDNVSQLQESVIDRQRTDWNSVVLLLLLTVPAAVMALMLFLWPETLWVAEIPYATIDILGSFAAILLSVFIMARYRELPGIPYISAGLLATGIIGGFHAVSPPGSSAFVWLHLLAGVSAAAFFTCYVLTVTTRLPIPPIKASGRRIGWLLIGVAAGALLLGVLSITFADLLPTIVQGRQFTAVAWAINTVPVALFLFAGISVFRQYRKTGAHELFLFAAIVIFLFQASEVSYFATPWGVIWWLWQTLRLVVYFVALGYVFKEYIQMSDSLATESGQRQKVEGALRKAEQDWRNSFNSLEDIMLVVGKDFSIENVNTSGLAFLGKSEEEVIGGKCYQVVHGEDSPGEDCPFRLTLESKRVESVERYDELHDKHFSIRCSPMFDEEGEVTKFVYLMSDVTKRVKAEAQERLLQQEFSLASRLASVGEMAAGIAHEINNPLTGVIGFAQMLAKMDVPEDIKEAVNVINDGAKRAAGVVEKLLTFARRSRPGREAADVNAIISGIAEMRSYEMRTNNIAITTQLCPDLPLTMANVGQLQQVFLNIIMNAEQAMAEAHEGGKLAIKTEAIDSTIRVSITDDGSGIARESIDKIFDPFFTTKDRNGGTGLGLSISYGIIKEHGGKISASSVPGNGATFVVDLPLVTEPREPEMAEPPVVKEPEKKTGANIMVVDDEPHICQVVDRLLTREGHKVEALSSAEAALDRLNTAEVDLILLDIRMPGMNGIEFYNRISEIDPSLQRKVVCITGDVISASNKSFLDEAGIPCITKPFGLNELISQVTSALAQQATSEVQSAHSSSR